MAGLVIGTNGAAAAAYSREFGLDASGVAFVFGFAALGAGASLVLSRAMDRVGRQRVAVASAVGVAVGAAGIAAAPDYFWFVVGQVVAACAGGTLGSSATVIISERLADDHRASGQAMGAFAGTVGIGAAIVLVAVVESSGGSWRVVWAAVAIGALTLTVFGRRLPETDAFRAEIAQGNRARGVLRALFAPEFRSWTLAAAVNGVLVNLAALSTQSWVLFHPETALDFSPAKATAIVIGGGALGLAGLPLGAWLAGAIGRRSTYGFFGTASLGFYVLYFHVPGDFPVSPALVMAALFAAGAATFGAAVVALRTLLTELYPTRLRGTQQGLLAACGAAGAVLAQAGTAALVPWMGGLVPTVTLLGLVGIPGIVALCAVVPETGGVRRDE